MRVRKHTHASDLNDLPGKLAAYNRQARSYRIRPADDEPVVWTKVVPLAAVLPLAAAALAPHGVWAQCVSAASAVTPLGVVNNRHGYGVDLDLDGTRDFEFQRDSAGDGHLLIGVRNGASVIAPPAGDYFYVSRFTYGQNISSGNGNWQAAATLGMVGGLDDAATLAYTYAGGTSLGNWAGGGTGYVGVRIDGNRLGFIEVTYNGMDNPITFGLMGVEPSGSGLTSVTAGNCGSLPVELIAFNALAGEGAVLLDWMTASETNNAGFEVQRSRDGVAYSKIGWVEGQGTTSEAIGYRFTDEDVAPGTSYYYRLKQIDYDGTFEYSEVVTLTTAAVDQMLVHEMAPNPAHPGQVTLRIDAERQRVVQVIVYNVIGQAVRQREVALTSGRNEVVLDLGGLSAGSYFVKVATPSKTVYRSLVLAR